MLFGLCPTLFLAQGLQVEIYLGVLFVRRVDAKVKSGRINLIGFELQAYPLSISRKSCEFVDSRNVRTALRRQWNNLFFVLKDFDFDAVQRGIWLVTDVQKNAKSHLLAVELLHGVLSARIWRFARVVSHLTKRSFKPHL